MSVREFEIKKPLSAEQRKLQEAELLLGGCRDTDYIMALDEKGEQPSSLEFARHLQKISGEGKGTIGFIIGGADGLHTEIHRRANRIISFGRMTFPHMLIRGLLAEQLYRSFTIMTNHPYHRE